MASISGYRIKLQEQNNKCNHTINGKNNFVDSEHNMTLETCANFCDGNDKCKFFFFNEINYCELYRSCSILKGSSKYQGTTYEKVYKGNINIRARYQETMKRVRYSLFT